MYTVSIDCPDIPDEQRIDYEEAVGMALDILCHPEHWTPQELERRSDWKALAESLKQAYGM